MGAKKTPSTPTKKLSKDSPPKKFVTATSNNKKTSPVANNHEKIAAMKKSQIAGDQKKNKSRDNSSDNKKQDVNSRKSSSIVADQAEVSKDEKCNKISENSIKEPKRVNNVQKTADKTKLSLKKTKAKIKIPNELKNLAIDGIQKELSSGLKTSICEMVKLKKARHNPNPNNSSKGKETQDDELKCSDEIINGVKVIKKIINTASKISDSEIKKIETKKLNDAKKIEAKKINDEAKKLAIIVKKIEAKKLIEDAKKASDLKKSIDLAKKLEAKKLTEKKIEAKKSDDPKKVSSPQPKKPFLSPPIKPTNKLISPTNQKEKKKKEVGNQSSAKSKVNNDDKVPITKNNESKVDNKGKNKIEHAINPTKVNVIVTQMKKTLQKSKNKPIEKDPLKISSSSSEESETEKDSDKVFKKPPKPKAKPAVRAIKIVKRITSIKKSRVASLNAIAKVHCLYENEARVQHLDHLKVVKKPAVVSVCHVSSEDDDEDEHDIKECLVKRSLRTAPGLRAVGKHWEMDSMSSEIDTDDSDDDNDDAKDEAKAKAIKLKNQQQKSKQQQLSKLKNQIKKSHSVKQIRSVEDSKREIELVVDKKAFKNKKKTTQIVSSLKKSALIKKSNGSIKRKKTKDDDKSGDKNIVTKKRMASLNASAILAANYEIENYAAKHESSSTETSDSSDSDEKDDIKPPTMKKEKKDVKMETAEEARPKSTTNLVKIDTDVTITGVYVNTALVSSQETICKTLKYRTAYSVTEECVVSRPPTQEPPKSYTPLSALTNMRPPGQQMQEQCMTSPSDQYQPHMPPQQHQIPPQPQMYDPHMTGPMPPYPYPPPHPMPSTSSAFYPPQQVHRDPMGYQLGYQPAGPLLSPHLLPPQPPIPQPPLESEQTQSQQSSGQQGENGDPDVMITGGDLSTPRPPYRYGPPPMHHQQMHYPTYPPYGYYGPPTPAPSHQDLCYPPYYPPAKYYPPNSPYNRRPPYVPPSYYQPPPLDYRPPQQPVVPQNQSVVPAAPTPQHIDPHYANSPYYPGYSGQCYSQTPRNLQPPAYLDAPQPYHSSSCPCPMQSCQSKNVHTGTGLIKAQAKGSVSASNGMTENLPKTSSSSASSTSKVSCKVENILSPKVVIKPENDKLTEQQQNHNSSEYPSMNMKVLDTSPELIPSPARGSTGLQMQIVQHEAVQPTENNNSDNHRKRVERHQITPLSIYQTAFMGNIDMLPQFKQEYPDIKKEADTSSEKDFEEINMGFRIVNPNKVKQEKPEEKHEEVKSPVPTVIEEEEEGNTVNLINESGDESVTTTTSKRKSNDSSDDVIELSDNSILEPPLVPPTAVKRRKLLEKPISTPKKSPPNSYKSLIKQSNNAAAASSGITQTAKSKLISPTSTINKSTIRRKNIFKAKTAFKTIRFAASKAKRRALKKKKKTPVVELSSEKSSTTNDENVEPIEDDDDGAATSEHHEERSMDGSSEYSGKSNIDVTIDRVAKGYFSESEIFSSLAKHRKTKSQKKFEAKLLDLCAKRREKKKKKEKLEKRKQEVVEVSKESSKKSKKAPPVVIQVVEKKVSKTKKSKAKEEPHKSQSTTTKKKAQKATKVVKKAETPVIESDDDVTIATAATKDEDTSTTLISSTKRETTPVPPLPAAKPPLLDETDVANNNDEYFKDNNHRQKQHEPLTLYKTPGYGWTMALNKSSNKRGKKAKYTKTKKMRVTLPNDIVIPKSTSIPRWSNGWVWEGEPYQALVFLNSDDPPVPRTCYDSMRHEECGDVIRPHDCVLLRAGGKRNELPYVAKVAQLWENPEDGEMMMSLFWYYRPEHTEQGRQINDAVDEVFASRHKDHNSVACIEDKCYVITYNEYCRYRKMLKASEENIEESTSLVPKPHQSFEYRHVPPNTSPELVMFCRRIYDFRAKRLVEDKTKRK